MKTTKSKERKISSKTTVKPPESVNFPQFLAFYTLPIFVYLYPTEGWSWALVFIFHYFYNENEKCILLHILLIDFDLG